MSQVETDTIEALTGNMEISITRMLIDCSSCGREIPPRSRCVTVHCSQYKTRLCDRCCKIIMVNTFHNKLGGDSFG